MPFLYVDPKTHPYKFNTLKKMILKPQGHRATGLDIEGIKETQAG